MLLRENEKSPTWRKFNTLISVITKTTDLEPQHFGKRKILTNFARKSKKKKKFFFLYIALWYGTVLLRGVADDLQVVKKIDVVCHFV